MPGMVLITGGSGFIGTHLTWELLDRGYQVRILDLVSPKFSHDRMTYIKGDVRDSTHVRNAVAGVQAVVHLAALVSVQYCQDNPLESYQTNLLGTCIVAECLREVRDRAGRAPRLIFASSASVYGDSGREAVALVEDGALPEPCSFYAAQKSASESLLRLYAGQRGVPCLSLRFFNVYGFGQDPNSPYSGVITVFAERLRDGRDLVLNGGGRQTRDFVSVLDVSSACRRALEVDESLLDGQTVNVGSGSAIRISDLATLMIEVGEANSRTETAPSRSGDVLHSLASIQKAERLLDWKPTRDFKSGLKELLEP